MLVGATAAIRRISLGRNRFQSVSSVASSANGLFVPLNAVGTSRCSTSPQRETQCRRALSDRITAWATGGYCVPLRTAR